MSIERKYKRVQPLISEKNYNNISDIIQTADFNHLSKGTIVDVALSNLAIELENKPLSYFIKQHLEYMDGENND